MSLSSNLEVVEAIVFAHFHSKFEMVLLSDAEKKQRQNMIGTKMRELYSPGIAEQQQTDLRDSATRFKEHSSTEQGNW